MKSDPDVHPSVSAAPAQAPTAAITQTLAAARVEVVAEIARFTVRGDEAAGFLVGSVMRLGARPARAVDLRIGDQVWARGELVNVDGELGVRLTEIVS